MSYTIGCFLCWFADQFAGPVYTPPADTHSAAEGQDYSWNTGDIFDKEVIPNIEQSEFPTYIERGQSITIE